MSISKIYLFFFFVYAIAHTEGLNPRVDQEKSNPSISFIKMIQSDADYGLKPGFAAKIKNVVFGKSDYSLSRPVAVVALDSREILVLDQGRRDIIKYAKRQPAQVSDMKFPSLVDVCPGPGSTILFTDSQLNGIFKTSASGESTASFAGNIKLNRPTGISWLKSRKEIWVVETGAHRITVLDESGVLKRHLGARGILPGEFNFPTAIWIDDRDQVYIIDSMNYRVQIFDADGHWLSAFGEQGDGSGFFGRPRSIACDSYGHIYVVDALFHTIQIFNQQGEYLNHFGKQGREPGAFWMPSGIFIDRQNNIYVADTYNGRIQVFQLDWNGKHVTE